jgi:hypothetical protein
MTTATLLISSTRIEAIQEATMTTYKHSRLATVSAHVKRIWSEVDYANRRMFDIRTGAHFMKPQERSRGPLPRRTAATAR